MDTIDTISQLLNTSNSQYRLYDIGRTITKLSKEQFEKVEQNQLPYPAPFQGHACIAIAFWQPQTTQPFLWLLKLPLDERGLLNQGARNHFIAIIVEALGSDLTQDTSDKQEELLKSNPYLFTPAQYKLAALNSKIKRELHQPASEHLTTFVNYLSDGDRWDNWQRVGVQGISDFVVALNAKDKHQTSYSKLLINALPHLPEEVLFPLCGALENETLPVDLLVALIRIFKTAPITEGESSPIQQHLLRALASNAEHPHVLALISSLLAQKTLSTELLITLTGRCWLALTEPSKLMAYLEHLVRCNDQALFNGIFKDIVALPALRPIVFQCIRAPERSSELSQAIGQLFNQA